MYQCVHLYVCICVCVCAYVYGACVCLCVSLNAYLYVSCMFLLTRVRNMLLYRLDPTSSYDLPSTIFSSCGYRDVITPCCKYKLR